MEKPTEEIRILKNLWRDDREKMARLEVRIQNLEEKLNHLINRK